MRVHERAPAFDISIRGDELEYNRIQLERNLQHTELSFRLSSTSDDEQHYPKIKHHRRKNNPNESSVEYPRHISEPSFHEFPSIVRSTSHHYADEDSQIHPWSYRIGDDEEGINPYGGDTVSTAAHHASALTLSAGLGGGRGARRDASLSGAEYDPERPLHAMIAGVNSKHSMFDLDRSKSKVQCTASMTCDPIVVDSTAELDRLLESGHAPPLSLRSRSVRVASPAPSASSSATEEARGQVQPQPSPRPKLTDHLRHVSFSPKRPRSVQSNHSNPGSPFPRASSLKWEDNASMHAPTPRPARRTNVFPPYPSSPAQPEVRLHPATPSTAGSKFSKMARGINKELEATQQQLASEQQAAALVDRNPFHDAANQSEPARRPTPRKSSLRDTSRGRVYLPDVTGLTSAVDSPAKPGAEYYSYRTDNRPRDSEARLLQTLSAVQSQLRNLEDENSISRRRVRELEMELEECKRHVARERTRLIEREELNDIGYGKTTQNKGKARAVEPPVGIDDERLHERYKEAVDEKKALEALINSLRSHLTRLTSELASHQDLLTELRNLRDSDSRALKEKGADIIKLREEVQRLAGEVEVLRGVVEEGLKERRASREIHVEHSVADIAMSQDLEVEADQEEGNGDEDVPEEDESDEMLSDEEEDAEPFDPVSIHQASSGVNQADRTMRTDFATLGSTNLAESTNSRRFVDKEELDCIAAEVEERRSNRSSSSIGSQSQRAHSLSIRRDKRATVEDEEEYERLLQPPNIPHHSQSRLQTALQPEPSSSRPSVPAAGQVPDQAGPARFHEHLQDEPETPFPQIRGEHLERLFFTAPEHNAKTCTVCYRRRHRTGSSPWSHPRKGGHARNAEQAEQDEDEGFGEGSDEAADVERAPRDSKGKDPDYVIFSKDPGHWRQAGRKEGLPPQTVVARVIREIEDDFTHYKSVYVELADQYKVMDAVSDVPRRNMLARHLREVVDILEQKGDQIASLYDLLSFKDKPIVDSIIPDKACSVVNNGAWDKPVTSTR
ncbi:hypothetical protein BYT27DRAFT_7197143 [Phlegmacium glaucopus]|nr:hypothetical protein BYT27DRAFT_7197143 [Phlegmacium glaucopus]